MRRRPAPCPTRTPTPHRRSMPPSCAACHPPSSGSPPVLHDHRGRRCPRRAWRRAPAATALSPRRGPRCAVDPCRAPRDRIAPSPCRRQRRPTAARPRADPAATGPALEAGYRQVVSTNRTIDLRSQLHRDRRRRRCEGGVCRSTRSRASPMRTTGLAAPMEPAEPTREVERRRRQLRVEARATHRRMQVALPSIVCPATEIRTPSALTDCAVRSTDSFASIGTGTTAG